MTTMIQSIMLGVGNFPFFAVLFTLPIMIGLVIKYKSVNFVRIGINYAMLLYFLCVAALVFFPLPTVEQAAKLSTHDIQLIPFHFIVDIIKESTLDLSKPVTLITSMFDRAILQVVFNVMMLIPFGMFLRYYYRFNMKGVVLFSLLLSLFIEITQLTGLYGLYKGSYRLCDIDDLMANTLGGFLGAYMMSLVETHIPRIERFDLRRKEIEAKKKVAHRI